MHAITYDEAAAWIGRDVADTVDEPAFAMVVDAVNVYVARVVLRGVGASVVPEVRLAGLLLASRLYSRRNSPDAIVGISEAGGVRVPWTDPDIQRLLLPYASRALG